MAYRNLMITTPCRIRCQREQLVVEGDVSASFPLEDLLSVLIESRQCTLTTAALAALAEAGVTVFACDEKHIPCALTLPFARHSRQLEITRSQLDWTQPRPQSVVAADRAGQDSESGRMPVPLWTL